MTDDDDLIDLDAVRSTVMETAQALHPGSTAGDARAVYRRVNWSVWIDGGDMSYIAIVTGVGDVVREMPPGGFEMRIDD
ncbi:MAG: hypothetical protein ACREB0_11725 [Sphingopyxis sp.]